MSPVLTIAILSALFAGSHVLLATSAIRRRLVGRLGELGFLVLYSLISWVTLGAALLYFQRHRLDGPAGLYTPGLLWPAVVLTVIGLCLVISILSPAGYVSSPMALFSDGAKQPRGLERITRHPMFAGVALFCLGHCLLSSTMVGVVFFGFLGGLGVVGGWHQDRKLLARRGDAYRDYLEQTSAIPFLAVIRGRQKVVPGELPWAFLGLGLLAAWGLRAMHRIDFAWTAHVILGVLVAGPIALTTWSLVRHRRAEAG